MLVIVSRRNTTTFFHYTTTMPDCLSVVIRNRFTSEFSIYCGRKRLFLKLEVFGFNDLGPCIYISGPTTETMVHAEIFHSTQQPDEYAAKIVRLPEAKTNAVIAQASSGIGLLASAQLRLQVSCPKTVSYIWRAPCLYPTARKLPSGARHVQVTS
jgi:hypothetical protein